MSVSRRKARNVFDIPILLEDLEFIIKNITFIIFKILKTILKKNMASEHLGSLKTRNFGSFDFAAMLLHMNKEEGQEFVIYHFIIITMCVFLVDV